MFGLSAFGGVGMLELLRDVRRFRAPTSRTPASEARLCAHRARGTDRAVDELSLRDGDASFAATVIAATRPVRTVLFAVGGGGDPGRHAPLLKTLAERGCMVVAPQCERLASPRPTAGELLSRARRLRLALDAVATSGLPVAGVGHSIGATVLLALAGGQVWLGPGQRIEIEPDPRVDRLVLMAPATGFFKAPGALDAVRAPILAWAGERDAITPLAQAEFLERALAGRVPVEVRVIAGAGHFSFMNTPPPHTTEPLADREAFLADLASEVGRFVTG